MNKRIAIGISAIILCVLGLAVYVAFRNKNEKSPHADAINFKEDYDSYNGKKSGNNTYFSLNIDEDNIARYKTEEETLEIIKNGTGIIYFGFSSCPWCRSMLPTLLKVLDNYGIEELNYLDIKNNRSTFELDSNNKALLKKSGTDGYYKLLEALDSVLNDYTLTIAEGKNKGKEVKVGEKRIYAPNLVFVKDGEILGFLQPTVESQKDPYTPLTEEQQEELYKMIENQVKKFADACNNENEGC